MLAFGVPGSGLLVLMMVGALPLAMGYAEHLLARDIKPANAFRRYTKDPPVGLETWVEHVRLYGLITNGHPRDWLPLAMVTWQPAYANNQHSERELKVLIGAGRWLAPGETAEAPLDPRRTAAGQADPPRALPDARCRVLPIAARCLRRFV
jgi:hypothetical protein